MFTKLKKFPLHCSSKIPTNYIVMLLPVNHIEPKKIAMDFNKELQRRKRIFYMLVTLFINNVFFRLNKEKEELLIPNWLFDETKIVVIRLPFAVPPRNEKFTKHFISKLRRFTNGKVRFDIFRIHTR